MTSKTPGADWRISRGRGLAVLLFCLVVLTSLVVMTIRAVQVRSILDNSHLMSDVWFQVTLLDAYIGFGLFYLWLWHHEKTRLGRVIWLCLIAVFGNMATSVYVAMFVIRHHRMGNGEAPRVADSVA